MKPKSDVKNLKLPCLKDEKKKKNNKSWRMLCHPVVTSALVFKEPIFQQDDEPYLTRENVTKTEVNK